VERDWYEGSTDIHPPQHVVGYAIALGVVFVVLMFLLMYVVE